MARVCLTLLVLLLLFSVLLCCLVVCRQQGAERQDATQEPERKAEPKAKPAAIPEIAPEAEPQVAPEVAPEVFPKAESQAEPEVAPEPSLPATDSTISAPAEDFFQFKEEEIDWSQFVFSDDPVQLPDGIYYISLYVNDFFQSPIEMNMLGGEPFFHREMLSQALQDTLSTESYNDFFDSRDTWYSFAYIQQKSVYATYDEVNLTLGLRFDSMQMPVQNLSMTGSRNQSRSSYNIAGAVELEPAKFTFVSNVNVLLNTQHGHPLEEGAEGGGFALRSFSLSVSTSNTLSFWDITLNIPILFAYTKGYGVSYSFGSVYGYRDFHERSLRLSFGSVGYLSFSSGPSLGVSLEKNYSYGTSNALEHQFAQTIVVEEDSLLEVSVNEKVVFKRNISMGVYRLRDFLFSNGGNDIEVRIHPLAMGDDSSMDRVLFFDQSYDASLLAKGDSVWRFGISVPIDFSGVNLFWEQSVGIDHNYTQSHLVSVLLQREDNGVFSGILRGNLSGIVATRIGTTRFNIAGTFSSSPSAASNATGSFSFGVSQSFSNERLKPLSISATVSGKTGTWGQGSATAPVYEVSQSEVSLNVGYSFNVWSLNMNTAVNAIYSSVSGFGASASLSVSSPLGRKANFSLHSSLDDKFAVNATFGLSVSIDAGTLATASLATKSNAEPTLSLNTSSSYGRNTVNVSANNLHFADILNHSLGVGWSYRGRTANIAARIYARDRYGSISTTSSLSTSLAFADGHFAMTNALSGPFAIIAPQKPLSNADIAVSNALESTSTSMPKTFGNVLYKNLRMYRQNSIIVFGGGSATFIFKATPTAAQGFVAKIVQETATTVSGVLVGDDGAPYASYSSPIYEVSLDEDGVTVQALEELETSYLFTEPSGRFVVGSLKPGLYMFNLPVGGLWYAVFFEVPVNEHVLDGSFADASNGTSNGTSNDRVLVYEDFVVSEPFDQGSGAGSYDILSFDDSYSGSFSLVPLGFIGEEELWDLLV